MIEVKDLENNLNKDGFVVSYTKGNSMLPFIKEGRDKVVLTRVNRDLRLYDVVLYKKGNRYILHRIIGFEGEILLIRGDNTIRDERVKKEEVLALLSGLYNKNGYIELNEELNKEYYLKAKRAHFLKNIIRKPIYMLFCLDERGLDI